MTNTECLLKLIKENPDLPVIPAVDAEVVGDDSHWWIGSWGRSKVTEYYQGRELLHFKTDDEEEALVDMVGCKYAETKDGRDVYDLSDEEWKELYDSLPWVEAIVVCIDV